MQCGPLALWGIFPVHLVVLELQGFDQVMKSTRSTGNQMEGISGFDVSYFWLAQLVKAGSHNAKVTHSILPATSLEVVVQFFIHFCETVTVAEMFCAGK